VTRKLEKNAKFLKVAQIVAKPKKCQNIHIEAEFESPKLLQQTTFETLNYLQQTIFDTP
jgi:hypothetical protein